MTIKLINLNAKVKKIVKPKEPEDKDKKKNMLKDYIKGTIDVKNK